ncbi:MAG: hypothetical protein MPK62_03495 [Alphaproteobacteria bacterium]|nr:hypothetical protein [Alphaproteobacteria bacterium]MDA8030193.1 hypothetical protein [Alphaproteobacteria bacterium]
MPKYDLDRHLFALLLGVGVLLSSVTRALLSDRGEVVSAGFALLICLCCLLAYYVHAIRSDGNTGSYAPENLYYMGLLFTLTSLTYSLIVLFVVNSGADDLEKRVYNLVGSFGIALISTIAGIVLRILLLQNIHAASRVASPSAVGYSGGIAAGGRPFGEGDGMQPAGSESSDDAGMAPLQMAHRDLVDAAFKLRQELTQTISDMNAFRRAIMQAAKETVHESGKTHSEMMQQVKNSAAKQADILAALSGEIGDKLTAAGNEVAAAAGNVKKSLDDLAAQQAEQRQKLIASGEKDAEQMAGGIRDALAKISGGGENIGAAFNAILDHLQNVARDMRETQKNLNTLSGGYDALHSAIRQTTELFSGAANEVDQVAKTISKDTKAVSGAMTETAGIAPQYTKQFAELIKVLRREAEQWQSMSQEVRTSMVQAIDALTKAIERK